VVAVHHVGVALAMALDIDETVLLQAPQHGAHLRLSSLG